MLAGDHWNCFPELLISWQIMPFGKKVSNYAPFFPRIGQIMLAYYDSSVKIYQIMLPIMLA